MANPLSIFSGPAQITTWDATNGYEYLGYNKEITVEGEPQNAELLDGNLHQLTTLYKLSAPLLQSNQAIIDAVKARRGVKQKLYIVGTESMLTLDNVLLSLGMKRSFKAGGDAHTLELQAQTAVEDDADFKVNLLGTSGKFETDSNSDGIADGWAASADTKSLVTSFLSGGGNAQKVTWDGTGDKHLSTATGNILLPYDTGVMALKITFSAYVLNNDAALPTTVSPTIFTYDKDGAVLSTTKVDVNFDAAEQKRISVTGVISVSTPIKEVKGRIWQKAGNAADITVDNAMLELGDLSTFRTD